MIDQLERHDQNALLDALATAGAQVHGPHKIRCPFHEDESPSAGIYADDKGIWRFKCHAASCGFCGDVFDVRARAGGNRLADVLPRGERSPARHAPAIGYDSPQPPKVYPTIEALIESVAHVVASYRYTNPESKAVDLIILRVEIPGEKKRFFQGHYSRDHGGWILRKPKGPLPIYNRIRIATMANKPVWIVEGEKCVHALTNAGQVATTSPGGAGKGRAAEADWSPLAGKTVFLWPDNDPFDAKGESGGIEHMRAVAAELQKLANPPSRMLWIDPTAIGLPDKGDAADWLAQRAAMAPDDLQCAIADLADGAVEIGGPAAQLGNLIEDTIAGRRVALRWPWEHFSKLTQALLPGTATIISGKPGSGKSYMALQAMRHLHTQGIPVAMYQLEDPVEYHLNRLMAQLAGNGDMMDADWQAEHPDEMRAAFAALRPALESFGRCITAESDEQPTYASLSQWVDRKLAAGVRVLCIDPVTVAAPDDKPWGKDRDFLMEMKRKVVKARASIILVTHPKKNGKTGDYLDDIAGGAAWQRFAHSIAVLVRPHKPVSSSIYMGHGGNINRKHNRVLHLAKTRNGRGVGMELAFTFGPELSLTEHGVISDAKETTPEGNSE